VVITDSSPVFIPSPATTRSNYHPARRWCPVPAGSSSARFVRRVWCRSFPKTLCTLEVTSPGEPHRVYFSRIAGEEATFVVSAEGMLKDYGIHTDRYLEHLVHAKYMR
jgi:hypothetical protein